MLKHKHQWPVGGKKEFTKDPLGSLQALIDFVIGHRDAGLPLYMMMGGWSKMAEILLDMAKMVREFRFRQREDTSLGVCLPRWQRRVSRRRCPRGEVGGAGIGAAGEPGSRIFTSMERVSPAGDKLDSRW